MDNKQWFYDLLTPGRNLDIMHINIAFYYLRKQIRYDESISISATTTDSFFGQRINSLYKKYVNSGKNAAAIPDNNAISEYIDGLHLHCNVRWNTVDFILMPVLIEDLTHWVLCIFNIHKRCLEVYNSIVGTNASLRKVSKAMRPYAVLLPILLARIEFFASRMDIFPNAHEFANKKETDPLEVFMVLDLPEQTDSDCGIFIIKFAEYFLRGEIKKLPNPMPVDVFRNKICVELYVYAKKKQVEGYLSESEFPGRYERSKVVDNKIAIDI
ncbi:uncharacterized protein LOC133798261 [Humulus lupulus]|uniref:uncharacterized protein LOC133798261 n=1 Tax=Humulus lupulus TaxID=3486 RepID=UPI002B40E908|nr:uncharacterized protein LOC133798261 [Humulus lupulus]XP_062092493.1 uncharacterized protein LOC133798261 [Humulus lupulus]